MRRIRLEPEAREEFLAAVDWYEARETDLGLRFLAAVEEALEAIRYAPEAYAVIAEVGPRSAARRKLLAGFPYSIVYVVLQEEIRVLAVAHGHRRPGYWRDREP